MTDTSEYASDARFIEHVVRALQQISPVLKGLEEQVTQRGNIEHSGHHDFSGELWSDLHSVRSALDLAAAKWQERGFRIAAKATNLP